MLTHANRFGLSLGLFLSFFHLTWVILLASGSAQLFMDWVFGLHMILPPYSIAEFDPAKAFMLVVFTFVMGYVYGAVFGLIWKFACTNCSMKGKK